MVPSPRSRYHTRVLDLEAFRPVAVVFDLDGTLVDNMDWHAKAFEAFVERHGLPAVTMEMRHRIDGKRNSEIFPILFGREMSREEVRAFEEEKEGAYRELSRGGLEPLGGTTLLLDRLAAHGIAIAVATSAPAENVAHTLAETGLQHRLPVIVRGDQVPYGKPAPDVFLHAARVLDVDPAACLAFEDAPLGVTAARAAGMCCVAITSSFTAESFASSSPPPHGTCADFNEFLAGPGRWLT
ncbi:MAG: HAD family phosphatase [Vicinamibacterales bacterium]